jgi:DNA replication protein DnaC
VTTERDTDARTHPLAEVLAGLGLRIPAGVTPAGPIPTGETAEDRAERLALQAQNRRARYVRRRPAAFADATMGDVEPGPRAQMLDWFAGPSRTLVLTGAVGTGKSHAAFALCNHASDGGLDVAAWTVPDLLVALAPDGDPDALHVSRSASLLLLDDIGVEKPSEWRVEQITALIDARTREGLRQIITTNTPYGTLAERYGDRALSRLTGGAVAVKLVGPDRRRVTW